jgi:hypothetical protein
VAWKEECGRLKLTNNRVLPPKPARYAAEKEAPKPWLARETAPLTAPRAEMEVVGEGSEGESSDEEGEEED